MGISVNLVISLCVFLFCFQQGVGLAFLVVLVVFSFRWFVGSNGWSSANLFIRAFIPSGAVGRGFTRQPGGSKKCTTWHTPLPTPAASIEPCSILNAHTTSCLLHQRGKKELARTKLLTLKKRDAASHWIHSRKETQLRALLQGREAATCKRLAASLPPFFST